MDHVGPRPSTVSFEDELGAHATAGWHQSVNVFSVTEVSYGHCRSEHVRHTLLYIPFARGGLRISCMLSPGNELGSRQAVRALSLTKQSTQPGALWLSPGRQSAPHMSVSYPFGKGKKVSAQAPRDRYPMSRSSVRTA